MSEIRSAVGKMLLEVSIFGGFVGFIAQFKRLQINFFDARKSF